MKHVWEVWQMFMYNFFFLSLRLEVWIRVHPEHTCTRQIMETLQRHVKERTRAVSMKTNLYHLEKEKSLMTEELSRFWVASQFSFPLFLLIHIFMFESSWKALQKKNILTAGSDELKWKPPSFSDRRRVFGSQEDWRRSIKMTVMQQMRGKLGWDS